MIAELRQTRQLQTRSLPGPVVRAFGVVGATLGVAAGFVQLFAGRAIPEWTGNKADTAGLGLATVVLAVVAAVCLWRARRSVGLWARWLPAAAGIAAVAVCFTTVGRLWYVPGPVLMAALILAPFSEPAGARGGASMVAEPAARAAAEAAPPRPRRALGWALYAVGAIAGLVIGLVPLLTVLIGRGPSSVGVAAAVVFAAGLVVTLFVAPVMRRRLTAMPVGGCGAGLTGGGLVLAVCAVLIAVA